MRSHIVVIKGYEEPNTFLEAAIRQTEKMQIETNIKLIAKKDDTPKRKTIKVKQTIVGFGIEATNLSESDSIILQEEGLGGKQKMGCGVFVLAMSDTISKAVEPKIEISLSDPGMTMLHRAGVAGLYITLKILAKHYPTK